MTNLWNWSTTVASNNTADGDLWSEGQLPSTVNNSARDNMASVARFRDDTSGKNETTGSSGAYVLTLATTGLSALADGMCFTFRANHTNSSTATLNVNSTGAKAIVKDGTTALAGAEITSGAIYTVTYVLASDHYRLHSYKPTSSVVTPAALTKVDDTNVTLTLGGTPTTALLQATSITVGWTSTLAVARGGTGASTVAGAKTNLGYETTSTDNAAVRFDSTAGNTQNSALIIADTTGALSRSGNGGIPIQGTNTNDSASAGQVGEVVTSTLAIGSAVTLSTGTTSEITTIALTAGDWDVSGLIAFTYTGGGSTASVCAGGINTLSATITIADPAKPSARWVTNSGMAFSDHWFGIPTGRVSLSGSATYYLNANSTFSDGTMKAYGWIWARRAR